MYLVKRGFGNQLTFSCSKKHSSHRIRTRDHIVILGNYLGFVEYSKYCPANNYSPGWQGLAGTVQ
jgi:hypothetical protein